MAEMILKLPLPWIMILVVQSLAAGFWLSNLSSRVGVLETNGPPNVNVMSGQLAVIGGKLSNMELTLPQVSVNTNRLTKLETELDTIRREIDRYETDTSSYIRGSFRQHPYRGGD